MSIEREAKLIASAHADLPDLNGLVPGASVATLEMRHLDATYYDTKELDLARWGITLRDRTGDSGPPWTLKLPAGQAGSALVRRELSFEGPPGAVPAAAEDLVRALVRSRPLIAVARLHTDRTPIEVRDETGRTLAEIVDDHVTVYRDKHNTDEFREVEVEVFAPGRVGDRLLAAATDRLVAAGCRHDPPIPKLVRALGRRALEVPEPTVPPVDRDTSLGNLVRHAIARCVSQVLRHDPGVRLGDDPEDVHQFRVGARRLRSDLRTFAPLLEPAPLASLRDELRWLGAAVGAVRDNDVLAERLRTQAGALPEPDAAGVQALMDLLAAQADTARAAMLSALRSDRYLSLLDALVQTANKPPIRAEHQAQADRPAAGAATSFVQRPWQRLHDAVAHLGHEPTDAALHRVRILTKRCRYAIDAVAPVADHRATLLAAALADVQTVLGDHQDAVIAEAWLRDAAASAPQGALAAGELILIQRSERTNLRTQWPPTWKRASANELRSWL